MKTISIGLCGLGTVGAGVINVWQRNRREIALRSGVDIDIVAVGARRDNAACDTSGLSVVRDIFDVTRLPEVEVVVELIGGTDTAKELVLAAIEQGKHVVTANKALLATHGEEILERAEKAGVTVKFEAAVAGGIPIIKALTEGLSGNTINSIAGIINGTGNYILTEMREKGRTFDDALADAQRLGYAEADPTFDIDGTDAAQKLVILSALAFGSSLDVSHCYQEGISSVYPADIRYALEMGYEIKHLAIARNSDAGLEMRVHPTLVKQNELLAKVAGVMNAVFVDSDAAGPSLFYGAGAGAEPTASAVVADIVDLGAKYDTVAQQASVLSPREIRYIAIDDIETAYYLRVSVANQSGVLSSITRILGDHDISVDAILQPNKSVRGDVNLVPIALVTDITVEKNMNAAIAEIEALSAVSEVVQRIRVEALS